MVVFKKPKFTFEYFPKIPQPYYIHSDNMQSSYLLWSGKINHLNCHRRKHIVVKFVTADLAPFGGLITLVLMLKSRDRFP